MVHCLMYRYLCEFTAALPELLAAHVLEQAQNKNNALVHTPFKNCCNVMQINSYWLAVKFKIKKIVPKVLPQ
jgi:hypothetical protein